MRTTRILAMLILSLGMIACFAGVAVAVPFGTAFKYQGRLLDGGNVANGEYDFQFRLYDANSVGNQISSDINEPNVVIIDGYFTVELDFGSGVFDGNERWLEISVRPGELGDPNLYTSLSPRQLIAPAPYALYAKTAGSGGGGGADSDWTISGNDMYSGVSGNVGIGTTSPAAKLDVSGDINTTSVYKIGGNTVLSVTGTTTTLGVGAGTTGNNNTFSGYQAGYFNTEGIANTFSGSMAGMSNTTGNFNTFSGYLTGYLNTTGSCNTFSGLQAGWTNTAGNFNTFSGFQAGYSNTTGAGNVFLGYQAGYSETGSNKLYIANSSANPPLIYGDFSTGNVGIGTTSPTAKLEVAGQVKIADGTQDAGKVLTSNSEGLASWQIPTETDPTVLPSIKDGVSWGEVSDIPAGFADNVDNVGLTVESDPTVPAAIKDGVSWGEVSGRPEGLDDGDDVGITVESDPKVGSNTTNYVPKWNGSALVTGTIFDSNNVGIGTTSPAAKLDVSGDISTTSVYKIGGNTVLSVAGTDNTFVGPGAGISNTTGSQNTFLGTMAGTSNTTGSGNTFSGDGAGYYNTTGSGNIFSGYKAGYSNTTGTGNTFSGVGAGITNTTGYSNTFTGQWAGSANTTGYDNTFSGALAGFANTTGYDNTFSGHQAGRFNTEGYGNTFSGNSAGYSNTTGNYNTFSGHWAGFENTTGYENTFSGYWAGSFNTTGYSNTCLGFEAGRSNTTGYGNVYLGYRAGYNSGGSNNLVIANGSDTALIYGNFSTGNLTIGRTSASLLDVIGLVKIRGGAPAAGKVLTSDVAGLASWQNPTEDSDWTLSGNNMYSSVSGNVGIGTTSPAAKLEVAGQVKITGGAPAAGKVLTSDSVGLATWTNFPAGGDITAVNAGTGLSGGGTSGDVTLAVSVPLSLTGSVTSPAAVIDATNTFNGHGVTGKNSATGATGFLGSPNYGVTGSSTSGTGVYGQNTNNGNYGSLGTNGYGVKGDSTNGTGVYGQNTNTGNYGSLGSTNYGVTGSSSSGTGVSGASSTGIGVYGESSDNSGVYGVSGSGAGVFGFHNSSGNIGSLGGSTNGVTGSSTSGTGVSGASSTGIGVYGESSGNTGVYGKNNSTGNYGSLGTSLYGGYFIANGSGGGVYGKGGPSGYAAQFDGIVRICDRDSGSTVMLLGKGLDYAEGFDVSEEDGVSPGTVLVIDRENPGKLAVSRNGYDKKVAGIVAGAKGLTSGVRLGVEGFDCDVALAGRVYCNVDAAEYGIEPGDMLTTSDKPGYAMKATDHTRASGAILGKAMEPLEKGNKGQILVLVTLQ